MPLKEKRHDGKLASSFQTIDWNACRSTQRGVVMKRVRILCGLLVFCMLAGVLSGCGAGAEDAFADGSVSENGTEDDLADGSVSERGAEQGDGKVVEGEPISGNGVPEKTDGSGNSSAESDEENDEAVREAVKVKGIYISGPIAGHARVVG